MSNGLDINSLQAGQALPGFKKLITQEEINLYASASRDFNPVHIDPEFARKTVAGGTIAHGMLILAYVSRMMTEAFGKSWLTGGRFNIRFKSPARPGDTISIQGSVQKILDESEQSKVHCEVLCANQKGDTVITGEAVVRVKR
ncbi:MAG: MaoC family dehydratase [Dehalococcoidales bacterium]|nr:MaoC family dehydratase [Dehalococcoidales bacterium]